MNEEDFRKIAEAHWLFIEKLLTPKIVLQQGGKEFPVFEKEVLHYLYVESMVHGHKHARKETE